MAGTTHYARGDKAWGICQRCGLRALLNELVFDGYYRNLRVHPECRDGRHPQERPVTVTDPRVLWKPSPESAGLSPALEGETGVAPSLVVDGAIRVLDSFGGIIELAIPGSSAAHTWCGWARMFGAAPLFSFKSFNGAAGGVLAIASDDGVTLDLEIRDGNVTQTEMPPIGEWFFWSLRIHDSGGDVIAEFKWASLGDVSFQVGRSATTTLFTGALNIDTELTNVVLASSHISGVGSIQIDFSQTRTFSDLHNDTQLLAERDSQTAVLTGALLFADNTMSDVGDLLDRSGNDNNITLFPDDGSFDTTDGPQNG